MSVLLRYQSYQKSYSRVNHQVMRGRGALSYEPYHTSPHLKGVPSCRNLQTHVTSNFIMMDYISGRSVTVCCVVHQRLVDKCQRPSISKSSPPYQVISFSLRIIGTVSPLRSNLNDTGVRPAPFRASCALILFVCPE